jgi:glycosyltransferase involved in cell wall biosynthesis
MNRKNGPRVSIITPSYNQAAFLEETICSVLDQDYPNLEYFIIDGGSSDGSLEIIRKYSHRLAGWISEADKGQTDAINKGFARATGQVFAWLNSDDTYQPGAISDAVAYLEAHPETGMVYGDANLIDESGNVIGKFPARQTDYRRLRRGYVHIPQQASFFQSDLWRKVGPLDPTFYFAMDYDLWVRLSRIARLDYTPRLWANFRLHGNAKSVASDDRCWPEMLRVHQREGGHWFSWLVFKAKTRPIIYGWLPMRLKIWIRQRAPIL